MKKLIASFALIVTFAIYAYRQRHPDEGAALTPPANLSANTDTINNPVDNTVTSPAPAPTPTQAPTPVPKPTKKYNDGTYTGSVEDAYYGYIQVQATISGDKITNVVFLQYPNDRGTSVQINRQADPWLAQEAIQAQSANVDIISGATQSSEAFVRSLSRALSSAKV